VALKKYFSRSVERRNGMVEEAADERQDRKEERCEVIEERIEKRCGAEL